MDLSDNAAHILIVDDDQRIRYPLAQYLFENGFVSPLPTTPLAPAHQCVALPLISSFST